MAVFMFKDWRQQQMKMVKSKSWWDSLPMVLVQSNTGAHLKSSNYFFSFFLFDVITSLISFSSFYPTIKFFIQFFLLNFNLLLVLSVVSSQRF